MAKYTRQAEYNRKTYVRFPLDLRPEMLEAFRAACQKRGQFHGNRYCQLQTQDKEKKTRIDTKQIGRAHV